MNAQRERWMKVAAAAAVVILFLLLWWHQSHASADTRRILTEVESTVRNAATGRGPEAGPAAGSAAPPERLSPLERESLIRRNPFKIDEDRVTPPPATAPPVAPPAAVPTPTPMPTPRRPPLFRLVGTIVGDGVGWAVLEDLQGRTEDLFATGARVGPTATLVAVERAAAVLLVDGQRERLEIDWGAGAPDGAPPPPPPADPGAYGRLSLQRPSGPPSPPTTPAGPGESTSVTVKRQDLEQNFQNLAQLLTQMRVQPFFENGRPAGFLVSSVKEGSFVERLGAKNGDVIRAVNGEAIDSVQKAFGLYNAFRNNTSLQLTVTRNGQPHGLNFNVE